MILAFKNIIQLGITEIGASRVQMRYNLNLEAGKTPFVDLIDLKF